MKSLSDKTALLITANLFKYAVGFVLPLIFTRFLTQHDYGTYQQLTLIANISTAIMVLGVPTSIYYFYHKFNRPTLVAQSQLILIASGMLAGVAILLAAPLLATKMHDPQLRQLLPTYAIYVGMFIAGEHFMHLMISQNRYVMAVSLELIETIFRVASVTTLLVLGYSLHAIVFALIIYAGLRLIGRNFWLWVGTDSMRRARWAERFPRRQLAYSLPLAASACVGVVLGVLDKAIVAFWFSTTTYAIYSVGALEIPLDSIFQASVATVLRATFPALINEGRLDEVVRIWRDSVRKLALIVIPSFVFLMCFADRIIVTLYTKRYEASVSVFHIYLLALPLYMFILSVVPQVFGRTRLNLYVVGIAAGTNVVLSFILLRVIGFLGPATAFVCSAYLASLLYFVVTTKLLKTRPLRLVPVAAMARTGVASCLAVAPAIAIAILVPGPFTLVVAAPIFGIGYLIAGYFLGAFLRSDIDIARSWLRRLIPATSR